MLSNNVRLTADGIALSPCQTNIIDDLYEATMESIAELMPWMSWIHPGYSIEEFRDWLTKCPEEWSKGNSYDFAITEQLNDGPILGLCGLNKLDSTRQIANLYYWVRTGMTRHGIATSAAALLVKWGIESLKLKRIEFNIASLNIASLKVAEKVGAHREGLLRNGIITRDLIYDDVIFSVIPADMTEITKI